MAIRQSFKSLEQVNKNNNIHRNHIRQSSESQLKQFKHHNHPNPLLTTTVLATNMKKPCLALHVRHGNIIIVIFHLFIFQLIFF